jgi:TonB-linked SusC/RagA family outer membrane protein
MKIKALCKALPGAELLLPKTLLIMKLTVVLLITACLQLSAKSYSQKITISEKRASLEKIFKQIHKQTGFQFLYKEELIQKAGRIDIDAANATITEVLDKCFRNLQLSYVIIGNTITIKQKDPPSSAVQLETPPDPSALIKGRVVDEHGKPLQGVSVKNQRSGKGMSTAADGSFTVEAETSDILEFSFVGYRPRTVKISSPGQVIDIVMQVEISELNTVVIGYGTVKKTDLTGSVSVVTAEKLTQTKAVSNIAQALQGQAAGVQVNQASGQPGEAVIIKIRGTNSIGADNKPLYVIDGLPVDGLSSQLNPDDIASIQVLKDASSVAIYGSRGANGVILITTKKGKAGKTQVAYNGYLGVQTLRKKVGLINASEYAELQNEVVANDNASGLNNPQLPLPWTTAQIDSLKGKGTDWQDEVYRPATVQDHNLSVSGGNENTRYYTSFGFYDQSGIIQNSNFTRFSFRGNLDQKINEKLNMTTSLSLQHSRYLQLNNGYADYGGIPFQTMVMPPTQSIYDANGNYTVFTGVTWGQTNPVGMARTYWNPDNALRLIGNTAFTYEIAGGLKLRLSAGVDNTWDRQDYYVSPANTFGQPGGIASVGYSNSITFVTENTLSYIKKFGNHAIDAVGGVTYQSMVGKNLSSGTASNFLSTIYTDNNLQAAGTRAQPSTGYSNKKLASYIGRINYNYEGKYFATVTGRYDGSSVFGENNKFAFFPSGALAWRISEEPFLKKAGAISNLKIRSSYGVSGNQAINPYQTLAQLNNVNVVLNNQYVTGYVLGGLSNTNLKWESTAQFDLGLDLGLQNDRIQLTADYYNKKTSNLLLPVTLPGSSGFGQVLENVGSVQNRGYEFQLTTRNLTGDLEWTSVLSFSHNATKVLALGNDATGKPITYKEYGTGGNWFPLIVGQSMEQLYGYKVIGVYQSDADAIKNGEPQKHAGDYKFENFHPGSLVNADSDRVTLTHLEPKFTFGFNNTFTYRNFDLSLLIVGSYGNDIVNEFRKYNLTLNGLWTPTQQAYDNRWRGSGTSSRDKPSLGSMQYTRDYANSLWVENGSYIRLRDITLGYNFSPSLLKHAGIASVRVYISAQNYLTITKYSGYDPEAAWSSATIDGWDRGIYPSMKSVTGGVKVNF